MIPILGALLGTLAENGLGLLSSAIQAKGKEVVEKTLGVKIPDNPTPEDVAKLRQMQFDHEERLLELGIEKARLEQEELKALLAAQANEENNVSQRWDADMASDSWLSKNIRKRKFTFHIEDVEKYGEHEDNRFTELWFYYETIVIEMTFEKFDQMYREWYEEAQIQEDEEQDDGFRFWIPLKTHPVSP